MLRRSGGAALAAWAGASAWVSLGTVAVTGDQTLARVAALPPLSLLFGLVAAATILAIATRFTLRRAWPLLIPSLVWLPYLPGRIPSAFLLWQGPLEVAIWIAVVVGLAGTLAPSWASRAFSVARNPRWAPWIAGAAMAACASAGFAAVRAVLPGGDEPHYLVVTQSLLLDGDLRIENNHDNGDYLSYFSGRLMPDFLERGADGEIYSVHAPGLPAFLIPAFALGGYGGAVAVMIGAAVLASALTWHVAWLISASVAGAWAACAAVFLTAPFFFHAFAIYPDGFGALWTMVGVWTLVRLELGLPVSRSMLAGAGAALSLLPWFHTRFALIAGVLGAVLVLRLWPSRERRQALAALLAVPLVAAATWFGFFWYVWGSPSPAAPYGAQTNTELAYLGRGAAGLLLDQQFGLLTTAPIYALAAVGLWSLARRRPRLAGELACIVVPYVLTTSAYAMWWGGSSAPARFLIALLPIGALPLAWWWPTRSGPWRILALGLLFVSVLLILPRTLVDDGRMIYNGRSGFDPTLEWLSQSVDLPLAFPSLHRQSIAGAFVTTATWLLAGGLLAAVSRAVGRHPLTAGATWTMLVLASAVLGMSAVTVAWTASGVAGITVNRSKVAAIGAVASGELETMFRLRPFRVVTANEWLGQLDLATTDRAGSPSADDTMIRVAGLPAGDYELVDVGGGAPIGAIDVSTGRNDSPFVQWRMGDVSQGAGGLVLRLPVGVRSATVRGDATARSQMTDVRLRPIGVRVPANADDRRASRAALYGQTRVFAFDEQAYLEPAGFWTRAGGTAVVVIDPAATGQVSLRIRAGAVHTSIELVVGDWIQHLVLTPGQQELVTLPAAGAARPLQLTIRSGAGFRPSAVDSTSDDVRNLAAWFEFP